MAPTAPYDARAVANFLLDLADERGVPLSQVSLLKLIYFAHGWYLAAKGTPLIIHDFEAWQYGPVVKVVRDAFRQFGASPITARATKLILQTGAQAIVPPSLTKADGAFVRSVFDEYGSLGPWRLSDMTHEADSPWDRLWNSQDVVGRLALRIKNEDIRAHFAGIKHRVAVS